MATCHPHPFPLQSDIRYSDEIFTVYWSPGRIKMLLFDYTWEAGVFPADSTGTVTTHFGGLSWVSPREVSELCDRALRMFQCCEADQNQMSLGALNLCLNVILMYVKFSSLFFLMHNVNLNPKPSVGWIHQAADKHKCEICVLLQKNCSKYLYLSSAMASLLNCTWHFIS